MKIPENGLPNHLFNYVSSITPLVNIDLLVCHPNKGFFLVWRDDQYYGPGWHIPGGIIRFKEKLTQRIDIVAKEELGLSEIKSPQLIAINQIQHLNRSERGHFFSFLFSALPTFYPQLSTKTNSLLKNGSIRWHQHVPSNLIAQHKRYIPYLEQTIEGIEHTSFQIGNLLD